MAVSGMMAVWSLLTPLSIPPIRPPADSQGRVVNFKNTIIILTSNLGAEYLQKAALDSSSGETLGPFSLPLSGPRFSSRDSTTSPDRSPERRRGQPQRRPQQQEEQEGVGRGDIPRGPGPGHGRRASSLPAGIPESVRLSPGPGQAVPASVVSHARPSVSSLAPRLDDITIFSPLTRDQLRSIMQLQMLAISNRLKDRNIEIQLTEHGLDHVLAKAYVPEVSGSGMGCWSVSLGRTPRLG